MSTVLENFTIFGGRIFGFARNRIFNMDETWIAANGRKLRVIVPRDWKTAPLIAENEKTVHITLIFCVSADGHFTTPTAILPNLQFFPPDLQDYQDHFVWSSSKSGWINEEIFTKWVTTVLIPHLATKRIFYRAPLQPAILFVDGHSTRSSSEAQAALSAANVFLVTLPSHTSHIQHDGGVPGQRRMLVEAAVQASSAALNPITIRRAFQKSGVCPSVTRRPARGFHLRPDLGHPSPDIRSSQLLPSCCSTRRSLVKRITNCSLSR